jgi:hypothetical protein
MTVRQREPSSCIMTDKRTDVMKLIANLGKLSIGFKNGCQEIMNFNAIFTMK